MTICLVSCGRNLWEAKRIIKKYDREYTEIDRLIRIDGYYYKEDSIGLNWPFMLTDNGKFRLFRARFDSHSRIQESFIENKYLEKGSYSLSGDTIKIRWAFRYDLGAYEIFSAQYLIVNNTTLRQIWYLCETCFTYDGKVHDPNRNEIFKFHEFNYDINSNSE